MSQNVIVITPDELRGVVFCAIRDALKMMPTTIADHEFDKLRRKEYLTTEEVEKLYGLKANTLRKRRVEGRGPEYSKDGDRVLYSRKSVENYLEARRQKTYE